MQSSRYRVDLRASGVKIHALRRELLCLKKLPPLTIVFRHEAFVR
jgi:hypothetical protein